MICGECKDIMEKIDEQWLCNLCDLNLPEDYEDEIDSCWLKIPHEDVTVIPVGQGGTEKSVMFNLYINRHD